MKATTWLCPVLTLLCATKLVYTAQRGSYDDYPLNNMESQLRQNDYFLWKRNNPSLSIVNPLNVLRQRLLLEIARRQMKENTRQVELNRAILKNVGKRSASIYSSPLTAALYDIHEAQQRQQQEPMQHLQPYDYESIPTALIFDYLQQQQRQQLQRPWLPYESTSIQFDNNYINDAIEESALASRNANEDDAESGMENIEQDISAFKAAVDGNDKHSMKHIKQSNNEHSATSPNEQREIAAFQKSINNRNDDTKRYTLINNHQLHQHKNDLNLDLNDAKPVSSKPNANANDYKNELTDNVGDYQLQRYLYHLHKNQNHLTRK